MSWKHVFARKDFEMLLAEMAGGLGDRQFGRYNGVLPL